MRCVVCCVLCVVCCRGVTVRLKDGGEMHADILVGADGIWSQVREYNKQRALILELLHAYYLRGRSCDRSV